MSELIDRNVLKAKMYQEAFESDTDMQKWDSGCWIRYKLFEKVVDSTPTVPYAPRWHRAEEPPKEEGRYWFAVWFDGHWIFDAAWYTHDISTVIEVPCCEQVGGFYKGNTEVHPDYWMPIEPPKEESK